MLKEEVKIRWTTKNKKLFIEKGYVFTGYDTYFNCKKEDIILIKGADQKIDCICDYCGKEYKIAINKYFRSIGNIVSKNACIDCNFKKNNETKLLKYGTLNHRQYPNLKSTNYKIREDRLKKEAFDKIQIKLKEKGYLMCPTIYQGNDIKVPYICSKHKDKGIQWIDWIHLKTDRGCRFCGKERMAEAQKYPYSEVKQMIESSGKNKLISRKYKAYNSYNLRITCEDCGERFTTSLGLFLKGKTKCNNCNSSKGEQKVTEVLSSHNINFKREYKIFTKEFEYPLRLDFYLKDKKIAIEYDGEQHFKPVDFNGLGKEFAENALIVQIKRDKIKNKYCEEKGIKLIRIPYTDFDNIESILIENNII